MLPRRVRSAFFTSAAVLSLGSAVLMATATEAGAATTVLRQASMEAGNFKEFNNTSVTSGTLTVDSTKGYAGTKSGHASYTGKGANGYARGQQDVQWKTGQDVWFSGAYYLPAGFKAKQQGQVSLMRWDNWSLDPNTTDQGGLVLHSTGNLVLVRQKLGSVYTELTTKVAIPEGAWTWVEVHQKFSPTNGQAINELYVNGQLAASSTTANSSGRDITRLRYGLVSVDAGKQLNNLDLYFDRATISNGKVGPIA